MPDYWSNQTVLFFQARLNFFLGDDLFQGPVFDAAHGHVLDEAHLHSERLPELDHVYQLVVVDTPYHHHVDLQRLKTHLPRDTDAFQHFRKSTLARQFPEPSWSQSVQAHCNSLQPRSV